MAKAGVTSSGVQESLAAARALPAKWRAAARTVTSQATRRVQANARERLRAQTRGTGATAAAITVRETEQGAAVESRAPAGSPEQLPIWIEYGSKKHPPRPYMGPAAQGESARYGKELSTAMDTVARTL